MDVQVIVDLISSVGLPITLVVAMGIFIFKLWKQSATRETKLYDEIKDCRNINKLAIETLSKYAERLGSIETDVKQIKDDLLILTAKQK